MFGLGIRILTSTTLYHRISKSLQCQRAWKFIGSCRDELWKKFPLPWPLNLVEVSRCLTCFSGCCWIWHLWINQVCSNEISTLCLYLTRLWSTVVATPGTESVATCFGSRNHFFLIVTHSCTSVMICIFDIWSMYELA